MKEEEDVEVETSISSDAVLDKYKNAAAVANTVMAAMIAKVKPGAKIVDLCAAGDALITEETGKLFKKKKTMSKGVAFPTCISVNHFVGHFNPVQKDDKTVLAEGDLVKIDFGVHFDGFISTFAHTCVATDKPAEAVSGRKADVICAAYFALEAAVRQLRPGMSNADVTKTINQVAEDFQVSVVEGVLSHQLDRFTLDGESVILSKETHDQHVDVVKFEPFQVWSLDVIMSTGEGKPKLGEQRSGVFKKSDVRYNLKQASARELMAHVQKTHNNLAWSLRGVADAVGAKAFLGLKEANEHGLVNEFPVLHEKPKEFVAQFKSTVLILPTKIDKVNTAPLPYVSSEKKVVNAEVNATMQLPLKITAAAAAPAPAAAAAAPAEPAK